MTVTDPFALLATFADETAGTDDCLIWSFAKTSAGYGEYRGEYVHRLAYAHMHGPIPPDHHVHHECRNPACFNPSHLSLVHRRIHRRQHHLLKECINGHPYPESLRADGRGCKVCNRLSQRERSRRNRASRREAWEKRNMEIRRLRAEGRSRPEVAQLVGTSTETVRRIDLGLLKRA